MTGWRAYVAIAFVFAASLMAESIADFICRGF